MSNALRIAHGKFGRVALLDMDASLVRHAHPHCHVLMKAAGADTQFLVRDRLVPLTDESAVLINAWEPHAYVHDPNRPRTQILALYIEPHWLSGFRPNWAASGVPGFFSRNGERITRALRRRASELAEAMVAAPADGPAQETLISTLMIGVLERYTSWRSAAVPDAAASGSVDFRLRRALAMIRSDPGSIVDMTALARRAGLSRAHFFRLFGEAMKIPPRVFLNTVRMETAVGEVMDGEHGITEVSDRLGFSAPAHFTRFFRDHAGAAPREFRKISRLTLDGAKAVG
jgi:AraC family transcriptional regulator